MILPLVLAWLGALALTAGAVVVAVLAARLRSTVLTVVAAAPIALGLLATVLGIRLPAPDPAFVAALGLELAALGVVAGGPLAALVLRVATGREPLGAHGGIVIETRLELPGSPPRDGHAPEPREVLRGGTTIGYLERTAIIAGVVLGRWEVVAVVVAIKGLGRFSELDSAEARERFIIGTLVSFLWAGAAAALIVL